MCNIHKFYNIIISINNILNFNIYIYIYIYIINKEERNVIIRNNNISKIYYKHINMKIINI